jgi:hypothetical protein
MTNQRNGQAPQTPHRTDSVKWGWDLEKCNAAEWPMSSNCFHVQKWMYTVMDARMGQACQDTPQNEVDKTIKTVMLA